MRWVFLTAMMLVMSPLALGQAKAARALVSTSGRERLGMSCAQILEMSSAEWVAQFNEKAPADVSAKSKTVRAIETYGNCYDARTDRLAAALGKKGTGPLRGAPGNFRDFDQSLKNFTTRALAANDPPADAIKTAYAALYAKQFRYAFIKGSDPAATKSAAPVAKVSSAAGVLNPRPAAASAAAPAAQPSPPASPSATGQDDGNPVTMAKNHFGELLDSLPEEKEHELHSAFGEIVGRSQMTDATRLEIYHYAIFLLEPTSAQPFAPPPF
jgi:hypothetical protein